MVSQEMQDAVEKTVVACEHITTSNAFTRKNPVVTKTMMVNGDPVEVQLCEYCVDYRMNAEQVSKALSRFCNGGQGGTQAGREALAKEFLNDHNTLVQLKMGLLAEVIRQFAAIEDRFCDPRNNASHEWAKSVIAAVGKDHYFPFI